MKEFLECSEYVDFKSAAVQNVCSRLFSEGMSDIEKAKTAFEFVRDKIPHSFDIQTDKVAASASDVLKFGTGICFAKANLLAALLRSQEIPTGFCYQHLTLADDESDGYTLHALNAIFLNGKWVLADARGNTNGKNAQFSLDVPRLAFEIRPQYDEYLIDGIFAVPEPQTMELLKHSKTIQEIYKGLPDKVSISPAAFME